MVSILPLSSSAIWDICWTTSVMPSTKEITAWLLSKLHVIRQLKCRLKIIQTERFRESSCKHCKTALLIEKNLADFMACHFRSL